MLRTPSALSVSLLAFFLFAGHNDALCVTRLILLKEETSQQQRNKGEKN